MSTTPLHPRRHHELFRGFDRWIASWLGCDMRLIYGLAIPVLLLVDVIVLFALHPSTWLVGVAFVFEMAVLALVVFAFTEMLDEDDDREQV